MAKKLPRQPSQRQLRVAEQIRHIVSDTLRRGHFYSDEFDISSISVTEVRISPDLKNATAFIILLQENVDMGAVIAMLNDSAPQFQKDVNLNSNLKFTPRIRFKHDDVYHEAQKIEDLLSKVKSETNSFDN